MTGLKSEAEKSGLGIARLRKRVAFELFLRRLVAVAPDCWILKGALALDFRFRTTSRPTRDVTEVDVEPELDNAYAEAAACLDPILAGRKTGVWDARRRTWR